ncbi:TniQ family protein [Agarivorans sp. DSG3-1]|uniref:TniQ family protein n=1 Tax=Agarivorans sp. DSG3-1 TaxID=3342249 RepID=UPI00398EDCB1
MTVMHTELPLRYRPEPYETLLGYMLRISHVNGYRQVQTMQALFDLSGIPLHSITCHYSKVNTVFNAMSMRLRIPVQALSAHFSAELDGAYNDCRVVQNIAIKAPKVCLACLSENKPMMATWRLAHVTHCEHHQVPLLSHCPECEAPLKWKPSLYSRCDSCDAHWKDVELKAGPLPDYQAAEYLLSPEQQKVYRFNLYLMVRLALRFHDMQRGEFKVFPNDVDDVQSLFAFSYRCLVDEYFREKQLQHRIDYWKENAGVKHLPDTFFDALHQEYRQYTPFLTNHFDAQECSIDVKRFQSKRISNPRESLVKNGTAAHLHLDLTSVADCMGLKTTDVSALVKRQLLKSCYDTTLPRDFWFNAQDIDAFYEQLRKKTSPLQVCRTPHQLVSIGKVIPVLRNIKWSIADVLALVLAGTCEVFVETDDESFSLLTIHINQEQLFVAINDSLCGGARGVPWLTIKNCFFVPPKVLPQFVFFLGEICGEQSIKEESVQYLHRFVSHYMVLNQWCRLRKIPTSKVHFYLQKKGLHPAFSNYPGNAFYVFEKSALLELRLTEFLKYDCSL